jgi:hypothetical protein
MRRCPIRNKAGGCSRFTDYIVGALLRNGCHHQYDLEDALQRFVFRLLSPVGETGKTRRTIFDFDETCPYDLSVGNPLQAIFRVYLANVLRSICGGKFPSLRTRQKTGTLSIGYGKETGEVSPDEIPARMPSGEEKMVADIMELLRRRSAPGMERPPRNSASGHPNGLPDVLARMIRDGVLKKVGARYVPGPGYARYPEPIAVG